METDEKTCNRALSSDEALKGLREVPEWQLKDRAIEREFRLGNFSRAMEFVNKVALLSEAEDHHPDIMISYDKVRLTLSTHKVGGLSCRDFTLAAKIDRLV